MADPMDFSGNLGRYIATTQDDQLEKSWLQSTELQSHNAKSGGCSDYGTILDDNQNKQIASSDNPSQIDILEAEIEDLEEQLEIEKAAKEAISRELQRSTNEIENLVYERESQVNDAHSRLLGSQQELDHVTNELAILKEKLEGKEKALYEVEQDLFVSKQEAKDLQDQLDQAERQYMHQKIELQGQLQHFERQRQQFTAQLSDAQQRINTDIVMGVDSHEAQFGDLFSQIQAYQQRTMELEEKYRQVETECRRSAQEIDELTSQQVELNQEKMTLKEEIDELRSQASTAQARQEEWRDTKELQQLRQQVGILQHKCISMEEEVDAQQSDIRDKDDIIDKLKEQLHNAVLSHGRAPLANSLATQISELQQDLSSLQQENCILKNEASRLVQDKETLKKSMLALKQEKSTLATRISMLEQVCVADGVVICVDLSGSMNTKQVKMAKESFRTIISGILARNNKTQLGVIVQESSIWTARSLSEIDTHAHHALDRATGGGSENYHTAIANIKSLISPFWDRYPGRATRVILIGDGQAVGGFPRDTLAVFKSHRTPIHNVIISGGAHRSGGWDITTSATAGISTETGGQRFTYTGCASILSNDALVGSAKRRS